MLAHALMTPWIAMLALASPVVVHVEESAGLEPGTEAQVLAALEARILQLTGERPVFDEARGTCDLRCGEALAATARGSALVRVTLTRAVRLIQLDLRINNGAAWSMIGAPGESAFEAALAAALEPLHMQAVQATGVAPEPSPSSPAPRLLPWVLAGIGVTAAGASVALAVGHVAAQNRLAAAVEVDPNARGADATARATAAGAVLTVAIAVVAIVAGVVVQTDP